MPSIEESVCCQQIDKMTLKCIEVEATGLGAVPGCITSHPDFQTICLDVWNLQAVYNEYRQRYGQLEKTLHEYVSISLI